MNSQELNGDRQGHALASNKYHRNMATESKNLGSFGAPRRKQCKMDRWCGMCTHTAREASCQAGQAARLSCRLTIASARNA